MTNISLNIITKNESENIQKNFSWLNKCPNINEVICVDDFSSDNTIETLKSLSNKNKNVNFFIHQNQLNDNFSKQRNLAVSKSTNNWILWLDPDETPSKKIVNFLNNFNPRYQSYSFKREDVFMGRTLKYGETANQSFVRLFNKNYGKFKNNVHEVWQSTRSTKNTNLIIKHYPHPDLYSFLHKINFYTNIRAQELYRKRIKTNLFQIIFFPLGKFIQNYIFRLGFLDSIPGIILALTMSFHSFLVRAKLWKLWQD